MNLFSLTVDDGKTFSFRNAVVEGKKISQWWAVFRM
jgi:hypothetical protein